MLHNVYFWLKKDISTGDRALFEAELRALIAIDYLESGFAGTPAPTEKRAVTDHSFDYSIALRFKSMADHDFYQSGCPAHRRFVDTCKTLWERVVVYDSQGIA